MIDQAIRARLVAVSAVVDLVGGTTAPRIYPMQMPQTPTFPCITYQLVSGQPLYSLSAVSGSAQVRIQIDCWAQNTERTDGYAAARALSEAVRGALSAFTGTVDGETIQELTLENRQVLHDGDAAVWRESLDWLVSYAEN